MKSHITTDLTLLMKPCNDQSSCGVDIRCNIELKNLYLGIKEARYQARLLEKNNMLPNQAIIWPSLWSQVKKLAIEALMHTKDLEILSWLTEALLREEGFYGLLQSIKILKTYINEYWENFYPLPDEESSTIRLLPLIGLNGEEKAGTLIIPLTLIPITQGTQYGPYSLWDYFQANEFIHIKDQNKQEQLIKDGYITFEKINLAVNETPCEFFQNSIHHLNSLLELLPEIQSLITKKTGNDASIFSRILQRIEQNHEAICFIRPKHLSTTNNIVNIPNESVTSKPLQQYLENEVIEETFSNFHNMPNSTNNNDDKEPENIAKKIVLSHQNQEKKSLVLMETIHHNAIKKLNDTYEFYNNHYNQSPVWFLLKIAIQISDMNFFELISFASKDNNNLKFLLEIINKLN